MLPELIDAGHPALDLLNTAGGATRDRDVERLGTYADAVAFAERVGLVDAAEAAALLPADSSTALADLHAQREALYAFLVAAIEGREPARADRERVERDVRAAHRAARLSADLAGPAWTVDVADAGPALIGRRAALATAELLAGPLRAQISRCGRCSWLFLDASPSKRRRWCSMETAATVRRRRGTTRECRGARSSSVIRWRRGAGPRPGSCTPRSSCSTRWGWTRCPPAGWPSGSGCGRPRCTGTCRASRSCSTSWLRSCWVPGTSIPAGSPGPNGRPPRLGSAAAGCCRGATGPGSSPAPGPDRTSRAPRRPAWPSSSGRASIRRPRCTR